jgi:hypothetical protein
MKLSQIIFENDEKELALSFKAALDKEMEDGKLDEAAITVVGVLSWALASNTIMDILGKYAGKKLRKIGFNKAADKAEALHNWAHNNETKFINFIGKILSPFIKDLTKRQTVAKGLFLVLLVGLGIKAGIGVAKAIKGASAGGATLSAVKGALKGRDIANVGSEIAAAI